jgi:hypothetical protein
MDKSFFLFSKKVELFMKRKIIVKYIFESIKDILISIKYC